MEDAGDPACPYLDWDMYCPISWDVMDPDSKAQVQYAASLFEIALQVPSVLLYDLRSSSSVTVDYEQFNAAVGDEALVDFAERRPHLFFACLSHNAHNLLLPLNGTLSAKMPISSSALLGDTDADDTDFPDRISIRVINFPVSMELREIKSSSIDHLKSIRGTVVRVSNTKPMLLKIGMRCAKCAMVWQTYCRDGIPQPPQQCARPECPGKDFSIVREHAVTIDWQKIRLQEIAEATGQGQVPITKDVEVVGEEVDRCVPGDIITVVGVIRAVSQSETRGKGNRGVGRTGLALPKKTSFGKRKKKTENEEAFFPTFGEKAKAPIYDTYVEANSLQNSRAVAPDSKDPNASFDVDSDVNMLSTKDLYSILQVTNHPTPFALIVASLCPTIYGHELVKAGLVLSLFGGSKRQDDRRDTSLRSDVHVLVVGDPGLGKSQMLTAVHKLAPRGVYVCGSYASTAGLTVSIQKDAGSHDFALEAGALVLANNGVACIDELDKMPNDLDALLEAMEQQQISVAKAGIVCSLPARATIMAAANPRHGHYDKSKSIAENLNMSTALLSRFDLIFVLLDKPDAQQDQRISEHIFGQHAGLEGSKDPTQHSNMFKEFQMMQPEVGSVPLPHQSQAGRGTIPATSQGDFVAPPSLLERLKAYDPRSGQGILSHTLLSRYLTYAKRYVEPVLTAPAKRVLQDFYLSLRRSRSSQDGTPVTTRQLESLIRLAEARAKVELRNEVTEQDVRDVIEIMKESLRDALDANGFESVDIRATGVRGDRKQKQIFVQELQKRARSSGKNEFTKQELYEISRQLKITPASSFDDFLDHLNHAGFILRSGSRSWKVYGIS